jgi:hypothetical protein
MASAQNSCFSEVQVIAAKPSGMPGRSGAGRTDGYADFFGYVGYVGYIHYEHYSHYSHYKRDLSGKYD